MLLWNCRATLICQSGVWGKLFSIDGSAVNFTAADFIGVCDYSGFVCRYARYSFTNTKNHAVNSSLAVWGPSGAGGDVIASIVIDGISCTQNRMVAGAGTTALTSTSCVKWVLPGSHTVDLIFNSSTGAPTKVGSGMQGGVVSF